MYTRQIKGIGSAEKARDVGIEAISIYVPAHAIDLGVLAKANNTDPEKYYKGLGGHLMAVAAPDEDPVTMAVSAAETLLRNYDIDPADIGLLAVGSESGVDCAKPIAAYVHGLVGLPPSCRVFDTLHACYSATSAFKVAADWCALRRGSGKKALVIATDIARYEIGSPGEPTQGAGAVALLVGCKPSILSLDTQWESVYAKQVMDFWRPHYMHNALVDGRISVASYLHSLEKTYESFEEVSGLHWNDYAYLMFHVPFPKMAYKGFKLLHERETALSGNAGLTPLDTDFQNRTQPTLWANRDVGNVYSGSLYLSLASLLERGGQNVPGARVGFFSYGSGCCAEFFSGRLGTDPSVWSGRIGLYDCLERRKTLSHEQYLHLRSEGERYLKADSHIHYENRFGQSDKKQSLRFLGIKDHQRIYSRYGESKSVNDSLNRNASGFRGRAFGVGVNLEGPTAGET